jgi:ankyrin repeat protein
MEIEDLLDLIELILTQKDSTEAFAGAISQGKFCFPYFDYLLSEGFLPDGVALLAATQMRQIEIVRFILRSGVKPTLESFQYAAEHEFFELCSLFVEFGSREILSTPELEDELIVAIYTNLQETAINLINRGVNFMVAADEDDEKAIQLASLHGYTKIVNLLLKHGDSPNNYSVGCASENGHFEVLRLLLEHGVDPTVGDNYAIKIASELGYIDVVRLLLEHGADPTDHNNMSIRSASANGHTKVVRLLLNNDSKYKVDPKAKDNQAIRWASRGGHTEVVRLLLKHGVDPTANDNYAIHWALQNGHLEVVRLLLNNDSEYKVDPTAVDNYAVKHASGPNKDEIIKLLKEYKAKL